MPVREMIRTGMPRSLKLRVTSPDYRTDSCAAPARVHHSPITAEFILLLVIQVLLVTVIMMFG